MTPTTRSRRTLPSAAPLLLFLVLGVGGTMGHSAEAQEVDPDALRSSFLMGVALGHGHNLYAQNLSMPADVRDAYDSWMSDASQYAARLGVEVNTAPPSRGSGPARSLEEAIEAGRQVVELTSIRILSRHGQEAVAATELGYRSAFAIDYLPFLSADLQRSGVEELQALARSIGLPSSILDEFTGTLTSTQDREAVVMAQFAFSDAVAAHFEAARGATSQGAVDQLFVWSMGWKLGLAALGQGRGADPEVVAGLFEESRAFADALGLRVPALPEATDSSPGETASALFYLMEEAGEYVTPQLDVRYGPRASALFELSVKAPMVLLLYSPGDDLAETLEEVIERSGRESGLPASIYMPTVRSIASGASYEVVRTRVLGLNDEIVAHFSGGAPAPAGQPSPQAPRTLVGGTRVHEDPDGLFRITVPADWTTDRSEFWSTTQADTYYRRTLFAPADAHLASVDGYLSEGIRVVFHHPPEGREWTMTEVSEWAPIHMEQMLEVNPGFVITRTSNLTLSGHPAIEYEVVGESEQIPEPEKVFFILVANARYRMVMEIVSPTSKLETFNRIRDSVIQTFVLVR